MLKKPCCQPHALAGILFLVMSTRWAKWLAGGRRAARSGSTSPRRPPTARDPRSVTAVREARRDVPDTCATGWDAGAAVRLDATGPARPDVLMHFPVEAVADHAVTYGVQLPERIVALAPNVAKPHSRGRVWITCADPDAPPNLDYGYFTDDEGAVIGEEDATPDDFGRIAAFAAARARRLSRAGRSRRAVAAHLAGKGVAAETAGAALEDSATAADAAVVRVHGRGDEGEVAA